ncbi:MAG: hypothetical protein B7733_24120 [Myxococcales bacterium FL481]|nr:MAG: hypothetical protein B7733_24120 [Myxococcales bacterium FL481]
MFALSPAYALALGIAVTPRLAMPSPSEPATASRRPFATGLRPPRWQSSDGQHAFWLNARVHFDSKTGTDPVAPTFYVRRARLTASATAFHRRLTAKLGLEFGRTSAADVRDAYVNLRIHDLIQLQAGQQRLPFSTERLTGSNWLNHPERPIIVDQLAGPRDIGWMAWGTTPGHRLAYYIGVFNGTGENIIDNADAKLDTVARVTARPVAPLFLAASYRHSPGVGQGQPSSETLVDDDRRTVGGHGRVFLDLLDDASIVRHGARHRMAGGPRLRWRQLEVKCEFQLEYLTNVQQHRARAAQPTADQPPVSVGDLVTWSAFGDASFVVTGEPNTGRDIQPLSPLFRHGKLAGSGAWQLNLRYERYHTDAKLLTRGLATGADTVQAATGTVIWTAVPGFRVLLSYHQARFSQRASLRPPNSTNSNPEHTLLVRSDFHF